VSSRLVSTTESVLCCRYKRRTAGDTLLARFASPRAALSDARAHHTTDFYEDIFLEMSKHGKVLDQVVCENAGQHLCGKPACVCALALATFVLFSTQIARSLAGSSSANHSPFFTQKAIHTLNLKMRNRRKRRSHRSPVVSTLV
jgi:uncharacterized protein YuzE